MPKLDTSTEVKAKSLAGSLKDADAVSAGESDVKYIKKIQAPATGISTADEKPANRPPRMGGCIPVSG